MSSLKGWLGELMTRLGLWVHLDKKSYHRFHNVIVPTKNGTTQIDHIIASPYGIFVIETKSMDGWIFGSEGQPKWTQSIHGKKFSFQNPLHQNIRHIKCLAAHLNIDENQFHSVVFFIGDGAFKTTMPSNVMRNGLSSYIRSFRDIILSTDNIERIGQEINQLKADPTLTNRAHVQSLKERYESTTVCPKCGSGLVERIAKSGKNAGSSFLGCASYPKCRFTRAI